MNEFRCENVGCVENRMPDGGYGLRYNDFTAILIKAMQELSENVQQLSQDNQKLSKGNNELHDLTEQLLKKAQ